MNDEVNEQPTATEVDPEPTTTTATLEEVTEDRSSSSTEPAKREPSRNVTFVEVDIVEHVPAKLPSFFEDESNSTTVKIETKKVYNDTLKAYVIENLPTLGPVKSNTGVGRPIRPRPKLDLLRLAANASIVRQNVSQTSNNNNNNVLIQKKTVGTNGTSIQQIIEVVTSISTKVSADTSDDQVILKLVVANSTSKPETSVESRVHKSSKQQLDNDKGPYDRSNSSNTRKIDQGNNLVNKLSVIANVKVSGLKETSI